MTKKELSDKDNREVKFDNKCKKAEETLNKAPKEALPDLRRKLCYKLTANDSNAVSAFQSTVISSVALVFSGLSFLTGVQSGVDALGAEGFWRSALFIVSLIFTAVLAGYAIWHIWTSRKTHQNAYNQALYTYQLDLVDRLLAASIVEETPKEALKKASEQTDDKTAFKAPSIVYIEHPSASTPSDDLIEAIVQQVKGLIPDPVPLGAEVKVAVTPLQEDIAELKVLLTSKDTASTPISKAPIEKLVASLKLVSLNAQIEASKSGTHFKAVADEMQRLIAELEKELEAII